MKHDKVNVVPLGDKLVVRRDSSDEITKGGIIIPDTAKEKARIGTILAVGAGRRNEETGKLIPMTVQEGQRILFSSYSGNECEINGEKLLLMAEQEILALIIN